MKLSWGCFLRPQGLTREPDEADGARRPGPHRVWLRQLLRRGAGGLPARISLSRTFCIPANWPGRSNSILPLSDLRRAGRNARHAGQGFANSQRLQGAVIMAVVGMRIYPGTHLFERAVGEGRITRDADLLTPGYYLAPGLTDGGRLRATSGVCPRSRRTGSWAIPRPATPAWSNACANAAWSARSGATSPCCSASGRQTSSASPMHETPAADFACSPSTSLMGEGLQLPPARAWACSRWRRSRRPIGR